MKNISLLLSVTFLFLSASCSEKSSKKTQEKAYKEISYQTIYFVRHAEKMIDGTRDPDLSSDGLMRADKLSLLLQGEDIKYIYSTDYKRTKNTGKILAQKLGVEIRIYNPSDDPLSTILPTIGNANALIIGHSNTTPKLVNKLLGKEKYTSLDEREYNKMFILRKSENTFTDSVQTF